MHRTFLCLLLAGLPWTAGAAPVEPAPPVTVAVFDFSSYYPRRRREATDLLIADLAADRRFAVLERGDLDKVLGERAMSMTQELGGDAAAHLGHLTGAQVLITGELSRGDDEGNHFLLARIIAANSGQTFTEQVPVSKLEELQRPVADLEQKIADAVEAHLDQLLAPAEQSHADKIAAIARGVPGSRRPAIAIEIARQRDFQAPANATVETELGLILQKAGFPIVDGQSGQRPDIRLAGEIVGEPGPRQGAMFFAQAAVNLKVIDCATGKILDFERQTAEATDLGEKMAMEDAYQNAADTLAAKLLPLLSR